MFSIQVKLCFVEESLTNQNIPLELRNDDDQPSRINNDRTGGLNNLEWAEDFCLSS